MTHTIFLPAITGAQQSAIAKALRAAGHRVIGSSRSTTGAEISMANLETGEGLAAAMVGADVVVLTLPQEHRPGKMTSMVEQVVRAATDVGAARIVLNTAGTLSETSPKSLFVDMRAARDMVRDSGLGWTILQPTVFLDNLLAPWSVDALRAGALNYPARAAAPISWISHADLAGYVTAVIDQDRVGQAFQIGGPDALTGPQLAAQVGAALGHSVTYDEVPLSGFAQGIDAAFGPPAGERLASLYAELETSPDFMTSDPSVARDLGLTLQTAQDFFRSALKT